MASITPPELRWTRRDALERGTSSLAALCLLPRRDQTSAVRGVRRRRGRAVPGRPPAAAHARAGEQHGDRGSLRADDPRGPRGDHPRQLTPVYGYDGIYPGPTIRARKGRTAVVQVTNGLSFQQNVHLHGGLVPAASDGRPMQLIAPGGSFTYTYPNVQDAATLWYHDHAHGLSARTMFYGLAGYYIVEDELEDSLDLPSGDFDVPLVIQDRSFNADGSLKYTENIDEGFLGDTIVVNGTVSPRFAVKRALYRLRFLNASNAREYRLQLDGAPMVQIAGDGGLLEAPVSRSSIPLGAGRARRRGGRLPPLPRRRAGPADDNAWGAGARRR